MSQVSSDLQSQAINRRSFLQAAAGALTVPLIGAQASAATSATAISTPVAIIPQSPVGYVKREDLATAVADYGAPRQHSVIPAEHIRRGDERLTAQPIRLQIAGIRLPEIAGIKLPEISGIGLPEGHVERHLRSLTLSLSMEVPGCDTDSIPWHLWSYSNQGVLNVSGGVDAYVPVRNDGTLLFDMKVQWGNESARAYQAKLTTGHERGVAKLHAGTYCIAVPDGRRFPSAWHSARWQDNEDEARSGLCAKAYPESQSTSEVPAPFAHLVFTIDHGPLKAESNA